MRVIASTLCAAITLLACKQGATEEHAAAVDARMPTTVVHPKVLASTDASCDRIVADDKQVFWTTRSVEEGSSAPPAAHTGRVMSCPVDGCGGGPTLVAGDQSHVDALALAPSSVYWTRRGFHGAGSEILKCARSGCALPESVHVHTYQGHAEGGGPSALAVDPHGIFWIDYDDRAIETCPLDGCRAAPRVLAKTSARPGNLALAQGAVFWTTDDGSILKCAESGCDSTPTTVGSAPGKPADIVIERATVVWVNHRMGADVDGGHASEILACPAGGCAVKPQVLVTTSNALGTLASHDGKLYWTESGGPDGDIIRACSVESCTPSTILTGVQVEHLSASGAGLFWTEARTHQIQTVSLANAAP